LIRFVIKSAFWLFILLVGITLFVPMPDDATRPSQSYSTMDALSAFKGALADFGGFCERNAQTCETGKAFFATLGVRARDGAGMLYQFLDQQFTSPHEQATQPSPPAE